MTWTKLKNWRRKTWRGLKGEWKFWIKKSLPEKSCKLKIWLTKSFPRNSLPKKDCPKKGDWVIEKLAKQQVVKREKLQAKKGGQASSPTRRRTTSYSTKLKAPLLSKLFLEQNGSIPFSLLSARAPRHLCWLDSLSPVAAEVLAAKQLAVQERRLKELERVRDSARACARSVKRLN